MIFNLTSLLKFLTIRTNKFHKLFIRGVEGHMHGKYPWASIEDYIVKQMANLVGKVSVHLL